MRTALARALSVEHVNQLGRDTGQSERLRTITPHRLFLSAIAALAAGKVESLADLLREFNHQNDVTVAYKAFYNRLARPGFAKFMRQMFMRLVEQLSLRMLAPEGHAAVARFDDIVIQDGSSFALKKALRDVFSGRFTTVDPAAVEVHATYSGFSKEWKSYANLHKFDTANEHIAAGLIWASLCAAVLKRFTRPNSSVASQSRLAVSRCARATSSTSSRRHSWPASASPWRSATGWPSSWPTRVARTRPAIERPADSGPACSPSEAVPKVITYVWPLGRRRQRRRACGGG